MTTIKLGTLFKTSHQMIKSIHIFSMCCRCSNLGSTSQTPSWSFTKDYEKNITLCLSGDGASDFAISIDLPCCEPNQLITPEQLGV